MNKSKTISFGKIDYNNNGVKSNEVTIELELKGDKQGRPIFSASGNVWNSRKTDVVWCGQCIDDIYNDYKGQLNNIELYKELLDLWKKYHLNDMKAGLPIQEKVVKEWLSKGNTYVYEIVCNHLKSLGLYEVNAGNGLTYKYGRSWIYSKIPLKDLERINYILNQ